MSQACTTSREDMIRALNQLAEAVRYLETKVFASFGITEAVEYKQNTTHFDRVLSAIDSAEGRPVSVAQIALATRLDARAVRAILYTHKQYFCPIRHSARRVEWVRYSKNPETGYQKEAICA